MNIAIVTGASSGVGEEFIKQLIEKYPRLDEIWAIARRVDRLERLEEKYPKKVKAIPLDLSKKEAFDELKHKLDEEHANVRILVNSAGLGKIGRFAELTIEEQLPMLHINMEALTKMTHLVLNYMPTNSRIINIASVAAFVPQPCFGIYAATKAYVLSFSRAINEELINRGIYVTAVCPGPMNTEFFIIAETSHKKMSYKEMFNSAVDGVVEKAIRDSAMGLSVSVYSPMMKLVHGITKISPQKLLLKIMKNFY